jgi:hypothetical protein
LKSCLDGETVGIVFFINSVRVYILSEDLAKNVDRPLEVLKKKFALLDYC